ncbi:hypothetical protein ACHQM5_006302 [Ranunculus cassubicifolius]
MKSSSVNLFCFVALVSLLAFASASGANEDANGDCCSLCRCTRSWPPQCQCTDVKSSCHESCTDCMCTKSIPPQCRCLDMKSSCGALCLEMSTQRPEQ